MGEISGGGERGDLLRRKRTIVPFTELGRCTKRPGEKGGVVVGLASEVRTQSSNNRRSESLGEEKLYLIWDVRDRR